MIEVTEATDSQSLEELLQVDFPKCDESNVRELKLSIGNLQKQALDAMDAKGSGMQTQPPRSQQTRMQSYRDAIAAGKIDSKVHLAKKFKNNINEDKSRKAAFELGGLENQKRIQMIW